jgi:hypothetical protein
MTAAPANAIALVAAHAGRSEESAQLLGAYDAWMAANDLSLDRSDQMFVDLIERALDQSMGRAQHLEQHAFGATLEPEDVHALALGVLRPLIEANGP